MTIIIHQIACQRIISGGQTGVDRGTLDACLTQQFPCGGWCPKDRLAEDGEIDPKYPLRETKDRNYDTRTRKNVQDSDGTLIISPGKLTGGTLLTFQFAQESNKPTLIISTVNSGFDEIISTVIHWLKENKIKTLNVAGPRESEWKQGFHTSFQIISSLILKINQSNK